MENYKSAVHIRKEMIESIISQNAIKRGKV